MTDTSTSSSPINVFTSGSGVNLNMSASGSAFAHGFGDLTVQTAGGTSAAVAVNWLHPALGQLQDVAFDATANEFIVSNGSQYHRLNPVTGAVLGSVDLPDAFTNAVGLQILPAAIASLGGTAVAAGSLLITDGDASFDKIFAVNPTDGTVLATLDLGVNINPVGGVYHAGRGTLFILDGSPDEIHELNPADGTILNTFAAPFGISFGDLAVDPVTGNLWVASSQSNLLAELSPVDGTVVRTVDVAPPGDQFGTEWTGL